MSKTSLASYTIRLRAESGENQKLDAFGSPPQDLLRVLGDCLESMKKKSSSTHDAAAQQVFNVAKVQVTGRTIAGIIESGLYGRGSKLRDVDAWEITYKKTVREAEMLPFYFLFEVPHMADEGMLIVERVGNVGIRKALGNAISEYVASKLPPFSFRLSHLVRQDVVKAYVDGGEVSAIRFIKFGLPSDFADMLPSGHKEQRGRLELVARMGRGRTFNLGSRIGKYVNGDVNLNRFVELEDFSYDTVKLDVTKNGETRVIDLNKLKMRGFYNISADVERDATGNPTFESIDEAARELLQDIKDGVYAPPEAS
ncbi:MAG: hypothetical protein WD733_01015 [Bryobacterales bacterium]